MQKTTPPELYMVRIVTTGLAIKQAFVDTEGKIYYGTLFYKQPGF